MMQFFQIPYLLLCLITLAAVLCVVGQVIATTMSTYYDRSGYMRQFHSVALCLLVVYSILMTVLFEQYRQAYLESYFRFIDYATARYAIIFILVALVIATTIKTRRVRMPLKVVLVVLTLPCLDNIYGKAFPYVLLLIMLIWCIASVIECHTVHRQLSNNVSAVSVKRAIDSLHSGILFCGQDGYVELVNKKMQRLMITLVGSIWHNGTEFYDALVNGKISDQCNRISSDEGLIYQMPDDTVWNFNRDELSMDSRKYFQINATDITEQWRATQELMAYNDELEIRCDQLRDMLADIKETCRKEEETNAKIHVHDIMGQRISLLLRMMRESDEPDEKLLVEFMKSLPEQLRETDEKQLAASRLGILISHLSVIGVTINIDGELPADNEKANIIVDIIAESSTNAVRHGFATEVNADISRNDNKCIVTITDNGKAGEDDFTSGGGITGMQSKLRTVNGRLSVDAKPEFKLTAVIPEVE